MLGASQFEDISNFERGAWRQLVSSPNAYSSNQSGNLKKVDLISILKEINNDLGNDDDKSKHITSYECFERILMKSKCYDARYYFSDQLRKVLEELIPNPGMQGIRNELFEGLSSAFNENYINKIGKTRSDIRALGTVDPANRIQVINNFINWVDKGIPPYSDRRKVCKSLLDKVKDYEWK